MQSGSYPQVSALAHTLGVSQFHVTCLGILQKLRRKHNIGMSTANPPTFALARGSRTYFLSGAINRNLSNIIPQTGTKTKGEFLEL